MNSTQCRVRQQQRGIPNLVLDWLMDYGQEHHDGHGATIRYFDRRARRAVERRVGREPVRRLHEYMNAYVVVGRDGSLITVGHRYNRIRR